MSTTSPVPLARSLFVTGRAFVTSAHAIVKSGERAKYRTDSLLIFPTAMLVAHAVEVYLKAWLAGHDPRYTERTLKHEFGHDLRSLYDKAIEHGLVEPVTTPGHTFDDLVESFEIPHGDYSFRYLRDGWEFWVPKNNYLFAILTRLDQTVEQKLGEMDLADVDWSVGPDEDFRSSSPL